MRYVIYGAGAIGGGIGGRLAQHGQDVTLIARGEHLERMRNAGLRLRTPVEDVVVPVHVVGHPSEIEWRGDEAVILTMKSQDTQAALDDLRAAAGCDVRVICGQNGVANERMTARRFPNVYGMLIQMPATYITPGEVILNGVEVTGVLDSGRYPSGVDGVIEDVCAGLSTSGFRARPEPDVMRLKYAKLLINLGNVVQAVFGDGDDARDLLRQLRAEGEAVLRAAGIDWTPREEYAERVHFERGDVPGADRGGNSTWQSIVRGRPSVETDYLNGEISLLGALHGVSTPANRLMQELAARCARDGLAPGTLQVEEFRARLGAGK